LSQWLEAGLSPERQLGDLEQQLREFRDQMRDWAGNDPLRHAAGRRLVSNWQRMTEFSQEERLAIHQISLVDLALTNEDLAALALPDRFTHIERVDLGANPGLSQLPAEFLERFPRLQRMHLVGCGFEQLPAIAVPQTLEWLDMQGNNLVWNDVNQAALDRLGALRMLDLSHNPLARSPDLNRLRELDVRTRRLAQRYS
jgi:Leucine-rich repeat (LRR) protein